MRQIFFFFFILPRQDQGGGKINILLKEGWKASSEPHSFSHTSQLKLLIRAILLQFLRTQNFKSLINENQMVRSLKITTFQNLQ